MSLLRFARILRRQRTFPRIQILLVPLVYVTLLSMASHHLYKTPLYRMDSIQYMGNALLMENTDITRIHEQVYAEVDRSIPEPERANVIGQQIGAPPDQNRSRELRSHDAHRFAEFLPLFAIRPLYNQLLYLAYKSGIGLLRSTILISATSYFLLGVLLFLWMCKRSRLLLAAIFSSLLMLSPPVLTLGRENISDALATLVAFAALYLTFEKKTLTAGLSLLLASIYFRTDFVVLAGPVLMLCWMQRRTTFWQTAVLCALAVGSVFTINYCAGDYGIKMLYYRNFIGTPTAPGELTVLFSSRDYISGVGNGVRVAASGFFIPFLLLGLAGVLRAPRSTGLFLVALAYAVLHFAVLPNWQERWFVLFYLSMGVVANMALRHQTKVPSHGSGSRHVLWGCEAAENYNESSLDLVRSA